MIGIRVEDELRVGQVLLKNKRIHSIDDDVIAAASTNCVGTVWWLCWIIETPSGGGVQAGRGANLRTRRGSVTLTAVDVEDVAGDE
jgi:hypothetical protein